MAIIIDSSLASATTWNPAPKVNENIVVTGHKMKLRNTGAKDVVVIVSTTLRDSDGNDRTGDLPFTVGAGTTLNFDRDNELPVAFLVAGKKRAITTTRVTVETIDKTAEADCSYQVSASLDDSAEA